MNKGKGVDCKRESLETRSRYRRKRFLLEENVALISCEMIFDRSEFTIGRAWHGKIIYHLLSHLPKG